MITQICKYFSYLFDHILIKLINMKNFVNLMSEALLRKLEPK